MERLCKHCVYDKETCRAYKYRTDFSCEKFRWTELETPFSKELFVVEFDEFEIYDVIGKHLDCLADFEREVRFDRLMVFVTSELAKFGETVREAYWLVNAENKSVASAAAALHISQADVKKHLQTINKHMMNLFRFVLAHGDPNGPKNTGESDALWRIVVLREKKSTFVDSLGRTRLHKLISTSTIRSFEIIDFTSELMRSYTRSTHYRHTRSPQLLAGMKKMARFKSTLYWDFFMRLSSLFLGIRDLSSRAETELLLEEDEAVRKEFKDAKVFTSHTAADIE